MTEQEVLKILKGANRTNDMVCIFPKTDLMKIMIKALEEIQQYREIGTPDELLQLKENGAFTGVELAQLVAMQMKLKEYLTIGTVDECRAAVEKQAAKIADLSGDGYADGHLVYDTYECPHCGEHYELDYDRYEYCPNCGQHMKIEMESDEK